MAHSNPSIRQESIKALSRFLSAKGKIKMPKSDIKPVAERLIKCVEDSVPAIRDAAALALACMMKVFTEKSLISYTEKYQWDPKYGFLIYLPSPLSSLVVFFP